MIHGHLHEGALIGSVVGWLTQIPVLFDLQGSLTSEMVDHGFVAPDTLEYYWWRRLEERIVQMPDAVITSTTHSAELLARVFARSQDVYPVPDSVNLDFFTPDRLSAAERVRRRTALGIPPDRTLVVYLGLLADYQGLPQLIQAAAHLKRRNYPVSFLIMGFPGEEKYQRQASELGLSQSDVIFTGRTRYADAPDHLALGDVGVAPKISATEGSGKILNYMAMGLPVVAYKTDVSQEYMGKLGVYADPVGDAHALAQALSFVLRNPEVARTMGRGLRERAGRHFSWARTGRQLLKIYRMLWERSPT
jgi:glycosyltransferase involved in cell wall biosynthesis